MRGGGKGREAAGDGTVNPAAMTASGQSFCGVWTESVS
ncbi:Hypothetical protein CAP_5314 [Chondromyces apiculatus DSM 436]|uniref:Uncharacterized protein n=1 Tax=Chondromyces apiculatus DSM 436 TaxID=1192034 RepID=A0A017T395_9BACT|nr:Hypothetical protein CAP_5314 [Chondromyces apiculatus DSM 436]